MKAINSEIWMQVFQLLATAALPSDAGNLSRTAKPLIGDKRFRGLTRDEIVGLVMVAMIIGFKLFESPIL